MDLQEAIEYLSEKVTQRPLWKDQEQDPNEPKKPFAAVCKDETVFGKSLARDFRISCKPNDPLKNGKFLDYTKEFLDDYAVRLNLPDLPKGYQLPEAISHNLTRQMHALKEANPEVKALLESTGIAAVDKGARAQTAYPEVFLKILDECFNKVFPIHSNKKRDSEGKYDEEDARSEHIAALSCRLYAEYLVNNTWHEIVKPLADRKNGSFLVKNALGHAANCTDLGSLSESLDAAIQAAEAYQQQNEKG